MFVVTTYFVGTTRFVDTTVVVVSNSGCSTRAKSPYLVGVPSTDPRATPPWKTHAQTVMETPVAHKAPLGSWVTHVLVFTLGWTVGTMLNPKSSMSVILGIRTV